MDDPLVLAAVAVAAFAAFLVAVAALLRGWQGWLDLKRAELNLRGEATPMPTSPAARIELADLRERVRRLEAIANGVEG